ncbi:MAG: choice-of-anchor Q domain-containing protein, partial [Candidatus Cloacimonadales bacterium]|nr:choice-of-anchor Q domain-containing protein [Candidatus Cloacimonadales bacterium]
MKQAIIFIIIFSFAYLFSQTTIPAGNVSGIWDLTGSPYLIEGEIEIPNGQTLTIDPGCLIEFQGHYKFNVQGRLLAVGTEQDSIRFTVADTTGFYNNTHIGWHGIRFENTPATNDSSKIVYSILEFGKATGDVFADLVGGGIFIDNSPKLKISHNKIWNNMCQNSWCGGGVHIRNSDINISNCVIANNTNYGIFNGWDYDSEIDNCVISNNSEGGISGVQLISNSVVSGNNDRGIEDCLNIINCKIYNNITGIESFWHDCSVINSLVHNNNTGMLFHDEEEYVDCIVTNCTFANNDNGLWVDGCGEWNSTDVYITNSIFSNDDDVHLSGSGIYAHASYCLFSELPSNFTSLQNMLYSNPLFVDPINNDFHLESYSPCLNYGTPDTTGLNLPDFDLDGNPRIFQGTFPIIDLGCYEFQDDPSELPAISIQNDEIEFENWSSFSGYSLPEEFAIFNTGLADLIISSIEAPDGFLIRHSNTGDYVQSLSSFTITYGNHEDIQVIFAPSSVGMYAGEIHIFSNAANGSDVTVQVSGESDDDLHVATNIVTDTVWDYENVVVHNDIQVAQNVVLEISPGTTVEFNYCRMEIYGNLIAAGDADNFITFTGNTIWKGMKIYAPSIAPTFAFCEFNSVRNNGTFSTLELNNCPDMIISNCNFINNRNVTAPACLNIYSTNIEIDNCSFDNNVSLNYEYDPGQSWGGGEAAIKSVSSLIIILTSSFTNNSSEWGDGGTQSIIDCDSNTENLKIINTLFGNNSSECLVSSNAGLEFTNCVSGPDQGYIFYWEYLSAINSILWNDDEIFLNVSHYGTIADILHSDIRGGQNAFYQNNTVNWLEGNIDSDPLFVDPENNDFHFLADSPCINAGTPDTTGLNLPEYDLDGNPRIYEDIIDMGCYEWQGTGIESDELPVLSYELSNFPNPFNPTTTINFSTEQNKQNGLIEIEIFNIKGQKVKTFTNLPITKSSNHQIVWDGTDQTEKPVSSGIYFYQLRSNDKPIATNKMILM